MSCAWKTKSIKTYCSYKDNLQKCKESVTLPQADKRHVLTISGNTQRVVMSCCRWNNVQLSNNFIFLKCEASISIYV